MTTSPVVRTQCARTFIRESDSTNQTDGHGVGIFCLHENGTKAGSLLDLHTLVGRVSNYNGSSSAVSHISENVSFPPIWTPFPGPVSHSIVGVFSVWFRGQDTGNKTIELPPSLTAVMTQTDPETRHDKLGIYACTISAYWRTGEIYLIEKLGTVLAQTGASATLDLSSARHMSLDVTGINTIHDPKFARDMSDANSMSEALSQIFALAVSGINFSNEDLWNEKPLDYDEHNMSAFRYITTLHGYGYGSKSTSIRLAMAVMTTYSTITIAYIAYIYITGSVSTAWNSSIELVALALQSKRPDHLGYTAVGLDSIETFKQGVGIRVNQDNELELVFAHDRDIDKRGLRKIERNKEY